MDWPYRFSGWLLRPALLLVLLGAGGCAFFHFDWLRSQKQPKPDPFIAHCQEELTKKGEEIRETIRTGNASERMVNILQTTDSKCDNREQLYLYALRLGRHDADLLVTLAYALYRGALFSFGDEYAEWKQDVLEKEMVDRLLYAVWGQERLYRSGEITPVEYHNTVRKVTEFFSWFASSRLPDVEEMRLSGADVTEVEVPEVRLLSHSFSTFITYFGVYSDHGLLGNLRNFEVMRTRLMELMMTGENACEMIPALRMSGLKILEPSDGFLLQSTVDVTPGEPKYPTSSYAFVRNPKSGEMLNDLLLIVPRDRNDAYRQWPGGNSYLLKPIPVPAQFSRVLDVRFREREKLEEDPSQKVFRLLGKVSAELPPVEASLRFVAPKVYRVVSYVESLFLKDLFQECGVPEDDIPRILVPQLP